MLLSSTQKTVSSKQSMFLKLALLIGIFICMLSLSACQTTPTATTVTSSSTSATSAATSVIEIPAIDINDYPRDYPVEVYVPTDKSSTAPSYPTQPVEPPITSTSDGNSSTQNPLTQQLPDTLSNNNSSAIISIPDTIITAPSSNDYIISPPSTPSRNELLERARHNSQKQSQQSTTNNSELPAFRNLMQVGTSQLKAGNLTAAENSFTRAQRIAPKSSAVYFYLAQVSLKKNQPRKAEAMARRGLSVSQDTSRRRALWQIILQSGKLQNNSRVVREANQALR